MTVDLGGEQVVLERAFCVEALGEPFTLQIDIVAMLGEIDLLPHMGKPIAIHAYEDTEFARHFHGLITESELKHESEGRHHYRLKAKPFTHMLSHNLDMAIFQDKSVPTIIKDVLDAAFVSDYEFKLSGTYEPRTYCVQYRESDFTFITRLMEEEGIYYYWRHDADKHVMIICDAPAAHTTGKPETVHYNIHAGGQHWANSAKRGGGKRFLERFGERIASDSQSLMTLRAFDFEKPQRPLQAQANQPIQHPTDEREIYSYPSLYVDEGRGRSLATKHLATLRQGRQVYTGRTQAIGLAVGTKVSVADYPGGRLNQSYLITRSEHLIQTEAYSAEEEGNHDSRETEDTHVIFTAIPSGTPFHIPLRTPKPVVQGLETAIVSGPDGEEIFTDEYGRVKVRFHWDRGTTRGEESTCWIRIAQFGGLGDIILPRVNEEVMVDFLHGNPDDPIIVGWVFNASVMPVYALPDNKTRQVWRSKSYPHNQPTKAGTMKLDTGDPRCNEIRFEDKAGKEELFIHAQGDMKTRVRANSTLQVGTNETKIIGWDRSDEVKNDEKTKIGKNQMLEVVGDQTETIKAKREIEVKATDKLVVGQSLTIEAGTSIDITAKTSINIKVGSSKITMDLSGITVDAPMITVKGGAMAKLTSPMTTVEGSGLNIVKGGLVLIN